MEVSAAPEDHIAPTLVQTIDASSFEPGSPDSSGVAYLADRGTLLVVDSEVDEDTGAGYHDVNMWEITRQGAVVATGTTHTVGGSGGYSNEPTGAGYDPATGRLFISTDRGQTIFVLEAGLDGTFGTADDVHAGEIDAGALGSDDTEDPDFAFVDGAVYFLSGSQRNLYRVHPGPGGVFGDADDVTSVSTLLLIANTGYEGLAYHPEREILLVGGGNDMLYEITLDAQLLRTIDVEEAVSEVRLSGLTVAPSSTGSGEWTYWIADRGTDNGSDVNENDGRIIEISVPPVSGNNPPAITSVTVSPSDPGTNDTVTAAVEATDADDDPLTFEYQWLRQGMDIPGATGPTLDLSVAGNGDKDETVAVRVVASDGTDTSSAVQSSPVTIGDSPPAFSQDLGDRTDAEGQTIAPFFATATDADADQLTYSATGLPPGISIDPHTGEIGGTIAAGAAVGSPYDVVVGVAEEAGGGGSGAGDSDTFSWTVTPAGGGVPGISLRGTATGANTGTASLVLPRPDGVVANDVLLASLVVRGTPTISPPPGWSEVRRDERGSTMSQAVFIRVAAAGEPADYTFTFSSAETAVGAVAAYAGVDTTSPIDAHSGQATRGSDQISAPSLTTTAADTLLVGVFSMAGKTTIDPPSAMTEQAEVVTAAGTSSKLTLALADEPHPIAGATGTRTATGTKDGNNIGQLLALRAAP